jgi:mono/diheme cytochrome c family protein
MRVILTLVSPREPAALGAEGAEMGVAALTGTGATLAGAATGATTGAAVAVGAALGVATCAACTAAAGAAAGTSPSAKGSITKSGSPTLISSPSAEKVSTIRPAKGLRTSTVT